MLPTYSVQYQMAHDPTWRTRSGSYTREQAEDEALRMWREERHCRAARVVETRAIAEYGPDRQREEP